MNNNAPEPLSDILAVAPHYRATDLAWDLPRSKLEEALQPDAMACLGLLLDEFGSVPVDTIPHAEMLPTLVEQGLVEDCTAATQHAKMIKLFAGANANEMPLVP